MHFIYGLANGNAREALRIYAERYPNRVIPHHSMFTRLHQRLSETGSFKKLTAENGHPRTVTPQIEEQVLNEFEEDPTTSIRKVAQTVHISNFTVWNILKRNLLYPYHIQRVQALLPGDFPKRTALCRWMQERIRQDAPFIRKILFTDEANFSRDAIMNFHNNHIWHYENPHAVAENRHQHQFSLNVWVGIIENFLIGPFFLPARLTGQVYQEFLENELPVMLEDVPIQLRQQMFFLHDGAPAHFSLVARQYLDITYPNRWIGRGGIHPWPPRSPDLNPLDFFLWGHLKSLVYRNPIDNVEELRNRIITSCDIIRQTPGIFERVRQSMRRRLDACIDVGGAHFEQLL